MQKSLIILGLALATVLTGLYFTCQSNPMLQKSFRKNTYERFQDWKVKYSKFYSEEEETFRFMNFLKAIEFVDNFKSDSVVVGLNKFADLSKAEFRAFNLGRLDTPLIEDNLREKPTRSEFYKSHVKTEKLGESFSYMTWNGTIYDPPVLDQGRCGSCWAFAAAEALSSFQTVNNPNLGMIVLSPQQITDCAFLGIHDGCNGGDFNRATTWTANHGITTDKAYPYISGVTEKSGTCDQSVKPIYYPNKGHMTLPRNYTDFANIMTAGPVKVSIQADQDVFHYYVSGVISTGCGLELDHDVLAIGWSDETPVAQIQNSWGYDWGIDGTVFLNGTSNYGMGACGFLMEAQKPTN